MNAEYYIVGERPVYSEFDESGEHVNTYVFDWVNHGFVVDNHYRTRIFFGKVDYLKPLTEEEFNVYVEEMKNRE